MKNLDKVKLTLDYQKDLKETLITVYRADDASDLKIYQLGDKSLTELYQQVSDAYKTQKGEIVQPIVDVLNPKRNLVKKSGEKQESVIIPSSLYQQYIHLEVKLKKLKQENQILIAENKRLKQRQD